MGLNAYTNVEDLKEQIAANDPAYEGSMGFVNYAEGIYVGYKFYETAAEEGLIKYEDMEQYPFGYGLSYLTIWITGDTVTFGLSYTTLLRIQGYLREP